MVTQFNRGEKDIINRERVLEKLQNLIDIDIAASKFASRQFPVTNELAQRDIEENLEIKDYLEKNLL